MTGSFEAEFAVERPGLKGPTVLCEGLWPSVAPGPCSPPACTIVSACCFVFGLLTLCSLPFAALCHLFTCQKQGTELK